jgi:hypothetical protein
MKSLFFLLLAMSLGAAPAPNSTTEINTNLMHATFEIIGPQTNAPGKISFGTVFFLGLPLKNDPLHSYNIMVTAGHVLDGISGDTATLMVRKRNGDGTYAAFPFQLKIRDNGTPLYLKHDSADVAVMYAALPPEAEPLLVPITYLVNDKTIEDIELHPGDEAFCLGFPLLASGPGGFPILRGGRIASYPLTPAGVVKELYFDLLIYPGNSGGPVYFFYENRTYGGVTHLAQYHQGILGLVTQQVNSRIPEFADKPLNFGVIVPAQFIREAIDKLTRPD